MDNWQDVHLLASKAAEVWFHWYTGVPQHFKARFTKKNNNKQHFFLFSDWLFFPCMLFSLDRKEKSFFLKLFSDCFEKILLIFDTTVIFNRGPYMDVMEKE